MKKTCKPGDLAIVISAVNPENIGLIVEVLRPHVPVGKLVMKRDEPVWDVRCRTKMVWSYVGKKRRRVAFEGPAPDSFLWPIRGEPPAKTAAATKKRVKAAPLLT